MCICARQAAGVIVRLILLPTTMHKIVIEMDAIAVLVQVRMRMHMHIHIHIHMHMHLCSDRLDLVISSSLVAH